MVSRLKRGRFALSGKNYALAMDMATAHADYKTVSTLVRNISENWCGYPSLENLAKLAGLSPMQTQKILVRWASLSPRAFLEAITLDHAKKMLAQDLSFLEAGPEQGFSGSGCPHDLFIAHEAVLPGIHKSKGKGLDIAFGFHDCQFGRALIMITGKAMTGMAFCDSNRELDTLKDMKNRWPQARYRENPLLTAPYVARCLDPGQWSEDQPLRVALIGTDFETEVWRGLLKIPFGAVTAYSSLAASIGKAGALRAVGRATGRNPLSFVVPCHRVLGKAGDLTGYHWGVTRKRAMLGWEFGQIVTK